VDISDLKHDPVVDWQLRYIGWGYVIVGALVPIAIGHHYGDAWAGFLWLGVMARVISWNGIWATNSLAHWYGDQPYSTNSTARGSFICAVICNGEGNHNYHHEFPQDWRHGIKWHEWDPTKWFIWVCAKLGLAYDLRYTDPKAIRHAELSTTEEVAQALIRQVQHERKHLTPSTDSLPVYTEAEFQRKVQDENCFWIKIDGFAHDVSKFHERHPGGSKLMKAYKGKDATSEFNGGLNVHTQSARFLASLYRVARIEGASELVR